MVAELLEIIVWTTALVVAAKCVALCLFRDPHRHAAVRCVLWVLILSSTLMLPLFSSYLPAAPIPRSLNQVLLSFGREPVAVIDFTPAALNYLKRRVDAQIEALGGAASGSSGASQGVSVRPVVALWVIGLIVFVIRVQRERQRYGRLTEAPSPRRQRLWEGIKKKLDVRRQVHIVVAPESEVGAGMTRSNVIFLSSASSTEEADEAVLAHEGSHLKWRHPLIVHTLGLLARSTLSYVPAVRFATKELLVDSELVADADASRLVGKDAYEDRLMEVLSQRHLKRKGPRKPTVTSMASAGSIRVAALRRRTRVSRHDVRWRWAVALSGVVSLAGLLTLQTPTVHLGRITLDDFGALEESALRGKVAADELMRELRRPVNRLLAQLRDPESTLRERIDGVVAGCGSHPELRDYYSKRIRTAIATGSARRTVRAVNAAVPACWIVAVTGGDPRISEGAHGA